jgi:hypothetical protein
MNEQINQINFSLYSGKNNILFGIDIVSDHFHIAENILKIYYPLLFGIADTVVSVKNLGLKFRSFIAHQTASSMGEISCIKDSK